MLGGTLSFCTEQVLSFLLSSPGHISPDQLPAIAEASSSHLGLSHLFASGTHHLTLLVTKFIVS